MIENLPWLFAAFAIGWAILFFYLYWISKRERTLRRKVAELESRLDDRAVRK